MAPRVVSDVVALVSAHPLLFGGVLILFTPPFFPVLRFFSPLLITTALFMLALFTMRPKVGMVGEDVPGKRGRADWLSLVSPRAKLKTDETVSILADASWAKGADFSSYARGGSGITEEESASRFLQESVGNTLMPTLIAPSMLFKVDSGLAERSGLGEGATPDNAPELEDVEEPERAPIQHPPLHDLQIPQRTSSSFTDSPYTDLDSSSDLDKASLTAPAGASGRSDEDTPVAVKLSTSGKLHQMEKLGDFMDDAEHAEKTGQASPEVHVLQPTTDEQVEAVKDQLENFVQQDEASAAPSPSPPNPLHVAVSKVEHVPAPSTSASNSEVSQLQ